MASLLIPRTAAAVKINLLKFVEIENKKLTRLLSTFNHVRAINSVKFDQPLV